MKNNEEQQAIKKEQARVTRTKRDLLEALRKSLGNVTNACQAVGVDRTVFYRYLKEDEEFSASVNEVNDVALDFVESKLMQQINQGNTACIIFYLKTQGKKRGYIERSEIDHTTDGQPLPGTVSVTILTSTPPITSEDDIAD